MVEMNSSPDESDADKKLSWFDMFFSFPEKLKGTQAKAFSLEEQSLLPSFEELQALLSEDNGLGKVRDKLKAPGWHLSARFLLRRLYALLRQVNNLLLPPLFTMICLEWYHGKRPQHFDVDLSNGLDIFFTVAFLSEWVLGLCLARNKGNYIFNFWLLVDLISVVPDMLGQMFRSLKSVRILRMLKLASIAKTRKLPLQLSRFIRAFGVAASAVLAGAIALHGVEPQTVDGMHDSLWWSLVTVSTVGYGDISPVTPIGRVVAGILIILGLGMFSYLTGLMTAAVEDPEEEKILGDLAQMQTELRGLKEQLTRIEGLLQGRDEPPDTR